MQHLIDEAERVENEETSQDTLTRLKELAEKFLEAQELVKEKEAELKAAKAVFNKLSMEQIPETLQSVGMTSFELATGQKVSYKEELSASVKDYDRFYDWLTERGDEGIVKTHLEIGKMPREILSKLVKKVYEDFGIVCNTKYNVHPMTLKSYLKKLCGIGEADAVPEVQLAEIPETMVSTFPYYKTIIK